MFEITDYRFGIMEVDGKVFDFDLILTPTEIKTDWWRKDGHKLHMEDLDDILDLAPAKLIIGNGANGRMLVTSEIKKKLKEKKFEVIVEETARAVEIYNSYSTSDRIIGAFHLTC